jgi:outer membrane protein assembly complex protein YaeT
MRGRLVAILCLAVGLAGPAHASVDDYIGKPIGSVRLVVEGRDTTDPSMTAVVETEVGRALSMVEVRESVAHLFSLGRFEDVRVDASLENGRVALRYDLAPIHAITAIKFAGDTSGPGIDTGALRRAITDRFGAAPPASRLSEVVRIVSDALAERGYLRASIAPAIVPYHEPEHAVITLTLSPGARTTIGEIQVTGTPSVGKEEMLRRLHLAQGVPFERERLAGRIQDYIADRRKHGYYQAKVDAQVEFQDPDQHVARLTLVVDPGPHVRVVWAGDAIPSGMHADLAPVEREGSIDEDLLEDSTSRIEEYLKGLGYREATAPHSRAQTDSELVITFMVMKGLEYRVAGVDVTGTDSLPAELAASLHIKEGQPFSDARIDTDRAALEDFFRRKGFAGARVTAGTDSPAAGDRVSPVPVRVHFVINQGMLTTVERIVFTGDTAIGETALASIVEVKPGAPLVPGRLAIDRDAVQAAYQDRGYENATVQARTDFVGEDRSRVAVTFDIQEGPQVFIDHVLIVGNVRTSTETIERELVVKASEPLSVSKVNESQRRLLALGLFRRVRINELRHGDETRRDLLVSLEESPPTTIGVGGGLEGKLIETSDPVTGVASNEFLFAPRAFFEVGRRNLFGGNRSVTFFSSVSQPIKSTTESQNLHEWRVIGTFREPRLFNTSADAFINATAEQQIRSSFTYARQSLSADIARKLTPLVSLTVGYAVQRTELVSTNVERGSDDESLIFRLFAPEPLRIASFSSTVVRDTRNDKLNPGSGEYFSGSGQLAAQVVGSEIGFVKTIVTAQTFRTVPGSRGVVLAGNARLGLAHEFDPLNAIPEPERFFAGGDTNRGFALDTLGVRHEFYDPATDTIDAKGFAIGGNATVILNGEVRVPVRSEKVNVVGFVDVGQVFLNASQIDLGELRSSVGFGVRYLSPFGPFRFDLGFKTRTLTFFCPTIDDASHQCVESRPALHISFGQAF